MKLSRKLHQLVAEANGKLVEAKILAGIKGNLYGPASFIEAVDASIEKLIDALGYIRFENTGEDVDLT